MLLSVVVASIACSCATRDRPLSSEERRALPGVVYFISEREDAPVSFRISPDGTGEARVLKSANASYPYGASADGSLVALVESDGELDQIVVARPDGDGAAQIATSTTGLSWYPAFSPDGRSILFESSRDAFRELYVYSLEQRTLVRLTNNREGNFDGAWSPDGQQIAFASSRHGQLDLFVMRADGSGQRRITEHAGDSIKPAWAPARCGRTQDVIAFLSARDGRDDVLLVDAEGGLAENLTRSEGDVESFQWRPDGCAIAIAVRAADKKSKVRVVDVAARAVVQLSGEGHDDSAPAWSPDGKWLAFASSVDGHSEIYVMRADGARRTQLTRDPKSAWLPRWLAVRK
ncbi:DPP IV N-terminal domain-containing protein [Myxococcota bacterium]|nr:DPP IV N-terminal domain-containing protein [Myxococcota bacterium]